MRKRAELPVDPIQADLFDDSVNLLVEPESPELFYNRLKLAIEHPLHLVITENATRMVSFKRLHGTIHLRLHKAFLAAPKPVIAALVHWIKHPKTPPSDEIRRFVSGIETSEKVTPRRIRLVTKGRVYDLKELFDKVNSFYFAGKITAQITYGRDTSRQRVQIRRLGSWSHRKQLITIHPLLDDPRVPEFVICFTIFHECLHALQPANHPRPHDLAFRRLEKQYPNYREVVEWHKRNGLVVMQGRKSK